MTTVIDGSNGLTFPDSSTLPSATFLAGMPSNSQGVAYTLVLSDAGKSIDTSANVTIPANASVAFPIGTVISITNLSASAITVGITTDTLRQAGTSNTGTRTIAGYGIATIRKVASTVWYLNGAGVT